MIQKFRLLTTSHFRASRGKWSGGRPVLRKWVMSLIQSSLFSFGVVFVVRLKRLASGRSSYVELAGSPDSRRLR